MANSNGSFGLRPIGVVGQGANTTGATEYRIASNNNTKMYQGSPVIPIAGGTISVAQAAAGGNVAFLGVFWVSNTFAQLTARLSGHHLGRELLLV